MGRQIAAAMPYISLSLSLSSPPAAIKIMKAGHDVRGCCGNGEKVEIGENRWENEMDSENSMQDSAERGAWVVTKQCLTDDKF